MAETLDMALLFLEERGGIAYGESPPETRRDFDRTVWDLGQALDREFPPFRAAEAQAVSRFMGFFSMAPDMTPWASAHERELARDRGLRAMRALLDRLPKGLPDAAAAQKWLDFYDREEKQAAERAERIRARIEESERTPEQAGMVVTPSGDVLSREAFERFARGAAVGNIPPSVRPLRALPSSKPVQVRGRVLTWDRRPAHGAAVTVRRFEPSAANHHQVLARLPVREDGSFSVSLPATGWEWTIEGAEGEMPIVKVFGPTALGKTIPQPWVVRLGKPGDTIDERARAGRRM